MISMQQVELAHWLECGMSGAREEVVRELEEQVERAFRAQVGAGRRRPSKGQGRG